MSETKNECQWKGNIKKGIRANKILFKVSKREKERRGKKIVIVYTIHCMCIYIKY